MKSDTTANARAELRDIMARITVKAWTDKDYAERLRKEPEKVLEDEGVSFPAKPPKVVFHVNTDQERHFVIPMPPAALSLAEADLKVLAAQRLEIQLELF